MVQIEDQSKRRYFLGDGVQSEKFHSLSAIQEEFSAGRRGGVRFLLSKKYHVNLRADAAFGKNNHTWAVGVGEAF